MSSYIIGSGWFLDEKAEGPKWKTYGDEETRTPEMHRLWQKSIFTNTQPEMVVVVNSDSPVESPLRASKDICWVDLDKNYGHSTSHIGKYSGWMRAHCALSGVLLSSDASWMIYVEQDALLAGKRVIETEILKSKHGMFFGAEFQSQPLQQSLYGIHRNRILTFNRRIERIPFRDMDISPESKFNWAGSGFPIKFLVIVWNTLQFLFSNVLPIPRGTEPKSLALLLTNNLAKAFRRFDYVSVIGGRDRPIPWKSGDFYVTCCTREELILYREKLGGE